MCTPLQIGERRSAVLKTSGSRAVPGRGVLRLNVQLDCDRIRIRLTEVEVEPIGRSAESRRGARTLSKVDIGQALSRRWLFAEEITVPQACFNPESEELIAKFVRHDRSPNGWTLVPRHSCA